MITPQELAEKHAEDMAVRSDAVIAATQLLTPAMGLDVVSAGKDVDVWASRHLQQLTSQIATYIKRGVWGEPDPEDEWNGS